MKADRKSKSQDVTLKLEPVGITKDAILTLADKSRLFVMPPMLSSPKSCDTMSLVIESGDVNEGEKKDLGS